MNWDYEQPVKIRFGQNVRKETAELAEILHVNKGMLIAGSHSVKNGEAQELVEQSQGKLITVFSEVSPNPDVSEVDNCAQIIRRLGIDFIVALGGGSIIDCAKAVSVIALTNESVRKFYGTGNPLPQKHLPIIAIPTTAGTGSEVTAVSVLTDRKNGRKAPMSSPGFYPEYALIDPTLTMTMPQNITAATGLDVLSHAIEAYWSKGHQPITDVLAIHAARLVFSYLPKVYENPADIAAREKMCEASLIAGLAFNLPKTTASHACSFPLTNIYNIPHGEACALTLDYFLRINASDDKDNRIQTLAESLGFLDAEQLAEGIYDLKKKTHLRTNLYDLNLTEAQILELVKLSKHPNLENNPVKITEKTLEKMYKYLTKG